MAFMIDPNQDSGGGGGAPATVTPGTKTLWICGVDFGTARSGNKKIDVRLVCVDDGGDGSEVGGYVWDTFTLTQSAAWRLQNCTRALGQADQFDAEDQELMAEILTRQPLVVDLEEEEFNDRKKVRPMRYHAHEGEIPEEWENRVERAEEYHEAGKAKRMASAGGGSGSFNGKDEIPF